MACSHSPEGILTIDELGDFIESRIPKVCPEAAKLLSQGTDFYRQFVLEQMVLHFDPLNLNRISIPDLLISPDFLLFIELTPDADYQNPYSYDSFEECFLSFKNCTNDIGLVDKSGFKNAKGAVYTSAFIDRLYDSTQTFEGCLDFGGFCRFMVHKQNCDSSEGARLFFDVFDVDGDGVLSIVDIAVFFKSLVSETDRYDVDFDNFIQELLDKTQCSGMGITFDDFVNCGACEEICLMLCDSSEFDVGVGGVASEGIF
jgi:Ca2+-binding EF-hand superfamily protein